VRSLGLTSLGFILGMIVAPMLLRWAALIHATLGLHGGDFLGPPKRRLLWATPLVVLAHPVPYFLVGAIGIVALALRGRVSAAWLWLLLGFCAYAVFLSVIITRTVVRVRKRAGTARDA
jgi:hypothetical protein